MTVVSLADRHGIERSPFAGADVCMEARLALAPGTPRPRFEDDVWDLSGVVGLPVQMDPRHRRLEFAAIVNPAWRVVAKELVLALLAPRHVAVAVLARASRTPLHLRTCGGRLIELTSCLNWLSAQGVASLGEVRDVDCEAYLAYRRHVVDASGEVVGELGPGIRRRAVQAVVDLVNYRELFSVDRVDPDLRPWRGASASAVAGMRSGRDQNTTAPVADAVLGPMLAAALYLVGTLGPPTAALAGRAREATLAAARLSGRGQVPEEEFAAVFARHATDRIPFPQLSDHQQRSRLARGWASDDPLLGVSLRLLANEAGARQFNGQWLSLLREPIEDTLAKVGTAKPWARDAHLVGAGSGDGQLGWTLPLHGAEVVALAGVVRTACIIVIAAVAGMRASELMELRVGCRRPPEELRPGLLRYRLASKVIKGQPLGGTDDEWVVIEPVYEAAGLAELLLDNPCDGDPLFGRFAFNVRYAWFRAWVNGSAGQRLGLAPVPGGNVSLRALRRTLAIELAYRPGGVLATKIHLKHLSVVTTEGYASRPGGAQAQLLAEVNRHEAQRNMDLILAEFRNYQHGVMPAGPGARELTGFFSSVDTALGRDSTAAPKVQDNDREVLALLSRRAATLHLGVANYCWFTDPSRALCLKLAGTPHAKAPLAEMCDSARCPQATHHPCHRDVWADQVTTTKVFLDSLGPTRRVEQARLQADLDRATRVVTEIDACSHPTTSKE